VLGAVHRGNGSGPLDTATCGGWCAPTNTGYSSQKDVQIRTVSSTNPQKDFTRKSLYAVANQLGDHIKNTFLQPRLASARRPPSGTAST
jgi:hypothetical protein